MNMGKSLSVAIVLFMSAVVLTFVVPVSAQIVPDANTVILDHLDDATVGETKGTLNYVTSLPGLDLSGDFTSGTYKIYHASENLESQGTVELWLNPRMYGTYGVGLVTFNWNHTYSPPSAGYVLHLILNNDGTIRIGGWSGSNCMFTLDTNSTIPLNKWTHIAMSWGSETKIYINGNVDISTPQCYRPAAGWGAYVYLNNWGANDLGYVDEFHISNVQRTDEEILSRVVPLKVSATIDIKPGSCPNPLNIKSKGVLSVAVLGTEDFDVTAIDPASIRLAGVAPIRSSIEDVSTPLLEKQYECDCISEGEDGIDDLTLKFNTQEIISALGEVADGDELVLPLTGELSGGTPIEGDDCIIILSKGKSKNK